MRRSLINRWLKTKGQTIVTVKQSPLFAGAMARLQSRCIQFGTIIDVGASTGSWTESVLPYFPSARYLCLEAQKAHEPVLRRFVSRHSNVEYVISAVGAEEGQIYFDDSGLFGGVASEKPTGKKCKVVPVTTIDLLVERKKLPPPYLIKLDTHGFEMPILTGAKKTLAATETLIIEVYNFRLGPQSLLFFEMCQTLAE